MPQYNFWRNSIQEPSKGVWKHSVLGAERILSTSGVMKLMSLLLANSEEYCNMLSQENLEFQPIWDYSLGNFASDKCIITFLVPNAAGNKLHVLMHAGMK